MSNQSNELELKSKIANDLGHLQKMMENELEKNDGNSEKVIMMIADQMIMETSKYINELKASADNYVNEEIYTMHMDDLNDFLNLVKKFKKEFADASD